LALHKFRPRAVTQDSTFTGGSRYLTRNIEMNTGHFAQPITSTRATSYYAVSPPGRASTLSWLPEMVVWTCRGAGDSHDRCLICLKRPLYTIPSTETSVSKFRHKRTKSPSSR
ncbi:unnamed protein product, partial [Scytosiphon promiscuus]